MIDGRLELTIQIGNAAMCRRGHIAGALYKTSTRIQAGETEGAIVDENGNTVGRWAITDDYRPIVNLATGHERHELSGTIPGYVRLERDPEREGVFLAPDGTGWIGCSDGVWRPVDGGPKR